MASRNLRRIGVIALTGIVTFVAMTDTSQAFRRRRAANYNSGSGCGGCGSSSGCGSCGCAAATSAPACGCTAATGASDQASNNGYMGQGQYTQGQQGSIQQGYGQQGWLITYTRMK